MGTYQVTEGGKTTVHEMSPEMEAIVSRMKKFNEENPDFWCHCGTPETGNIMPRGHSVDVDCRNCGGMIQIG